MREPLVPALPNLTSNIDVDSSRDSLLTSRVVLAVADEVSIVPCLAEVLTLLNQVVLEDYFVLIFPSRRLTVIQFLCNQSRRVPA